MNKKIFHAIFLLTIISFITVPFASATVYEMQSMTGTTIFLEFNTGGNNYNAIGQTLTPSTSLFMQQASFYLKRVGLPTGSFNVGVYNASGVNLHNSTTTINFNEIATLNADWYDFYFDGTYNLTVGTEYWICLSAVTQSCSVGNYIAVGWDASSAAPSSPAFGVRYDGSTWDRDTGLQDYAHYFYGWDGVADATPTPTAYPTYDPNTDTEQLYADLVAFLTPLLVMILPALLLWWLGGRGKWPLLIGLAIGTGLGYVFVSGFPLWLVFLVAIGIIGMAYSDVSSGGSYT